MLSLVYKQGQYWMYHSKSLLDDSFKNHADRVWKIVKYDSYCNGKINTTKVVEGDVMKFGRVRFKVKRLVIDKLECEDMEGAPLETNPNKELSGSHLRVHTTLENEVVNGVQSEPETRMTMNFAREGMGFDNRPMDLNEEDCK